ncbi:MAG: endonuclease NucS [Halobacteriota archaeon]|nr:endonuclease NucS [Halobacteriota archaeon]
MRIFNIKDDGKFEEFSQTLFHTDHEESVLENWLESNSDDILEDGKLLIIGRQVTTNLCSIIDLLGIDREGDTVVIELKRDRTPRDTLAQALEYASFAEELDTDQLEEILKNYVSDESINLASYHREYFELTPDEAVSFNKEQRIVLVGQRITGEIRQTASFLRKKGMKVTCLEFSYFQANDGKHLLSYDIVLGKEPKKLKQISSGALPIVSQESFMESLDKNGKEVFDHLLKFATAKSLPIRWGTKGFSMNVDKNGVHVAICFGYPPQSVFKQSVYTGFGGAGGLLSKLNVEESLLEEIRTEAQATGLFQPAGRELKVIINRRYDEKEIQSLIVWLEKMATTIECHELK